MTHYQPTWTSLAQHPTPQWFRDAKFGIYTHWGIYCVPARGPNATWYPYNMYRPGTPQHQHHCQVYGGPEKFGYKDFIPQFSAAKFDPDEWAELFQRSGAQYAGPVAEHHDGFAMWETRYSEWNTARMGPRRDVVGLLERAIRRQGLRFLTAFHHAENWWFYPHWAGTYDTADPQFAGLYGAPHNLEGPLAADGFFNQDPPSRQFLERWRSKIDEVLEKYAPDLLWFDFGLRGVPERCKQEMLAHYYNQAQMWGKEVAVTYKDYDLPPGCGVVDLELGRMTGLTYHEWITDTTVDDGEAWGYIQEADYKTPQTLVHYLVDNVSKNGHLLLNVGPKPDGTLPDPAKDILRGMGEWLALNGEAIYGTTPWISYGEGPARIGKSGAFNEKDVPIFSGKDVRYTSKDNLLYAICLGWPGEQVKLESLKSFSPAEIRSIRLLGSDQELAWNLDGDGLTLFPPPQPKPSPAYTFRIERGQPFHY